MTDREKQNRKYEVSKFRVKIKSLSEEASIIRREEKRSEGWVRGCLREHRIGKVRDEQRHTLVAYAFYRGVPYKVVEGRCETPPREKDVARILGSLTWSRNKSDEIQSWMTSDVIEKAA